MWWVAWKSPFSYYFVQTSPLFYDAFKELLGLLFRSFNPKDVFFVLFTLWASCKSKFSRSSWHWRYKIIWHNYMTLVNFGKSNIWLIRKIFQSQANIFILFTVWIIHQNGLNHPIFLLFEILKKIKAKMKRNDKIEDNLVTSNRWNDRSCVSPRLSEIEHFFSVEERFLQSTISVFAFTCSH